MTSEAQAGEERPYWFVGAAYNRIDHTDRFVEQGVWSAFGDSPSRRARLVKPMQPGDRIAIKAAFRQKDNLPFGYQGRTASVMRIKAVGVVAENLGDGRSIKVKWTRVDPPRDWYFYTNRNTVWKVEPDQGTLPWAADALIRFTFHNEEQDYSRFLAAWGVEGWDQLVERARQYLEGGFVDELEIKYKLEIGHKLASIRRDIRSGAPITDDMARRLRNALTGENNLVDWRDVDNFCKWVMNQREDALNALRALWDSMWSNSNGFQLLAKHLEPHMSRASRTNLISVLLMGIDPKDLPPYRASAFNWAYDQSGYARPEEGLSENDEYGYAVGFLDRFIAEAARRGLDLPDRLYAQSALWLTQNAPELVPPPNGGEDDGKRALANLANELFVTSEFLEEINALLEEKRQVIFQGPPGTGKTYAARAIARHLARVERRVTLVQFHPSYAYEDFIQGYRPKPSGAFELRDGPLLRAAKHAIREPRAKHFLIIDEINRGNLAKVFGELYFLLEYRGEAMRLQYSDAEFSVPDNLYIIGTMNTADRSIALVDLALRRRFAFVRFDTDEEPVKGLLRRWLTANEPTMVWVAGIVEQANAILDDRNAAVGPSYFMKEGLTEERAKRIWKHDVLPYIEERLYGEHDRLGEFDFDMLAKGLRTGSEQEGGQTEEQPSDSNDAST